MRRLARYALMALAVLIGATFVLPVSQADAQGKLGQLHAWPEPRPAPELRFRSPSGAPVTLSRFQGKFLVVNLWATWCAPCIREMPHLNGLQQRMGGPAFEVLTINVGEDPQKAKDFLKRQNLTALKAWNDPDMTVPQAVKAPGLPVTVLFDGRGREVGRLAGTAKWDSPEMMAELRAMMK